jgi:hypothetical protein
LVEGLQVAELGVVTETEFEAGDQPEPQPPDWSGPLILEWEYTE